MRRWRRWTAGAVLVALAALAAPAMWIEASCTAARDRRVAVRTPLVTDRGYARRESDSYLSFPEWHIIYAYEDLAGVLRRGDQSQFAYGGQIVGFWRSLCRLTRVVSARGGGGRDTKLVLYTTGWSFSAEMAIRGGYEKTVGRAFERWRGPGKTAEDGFAARDVQAYAEFLHQTPWYAYPFGSRLVALWRETPLRGTHAARKIERRAVMTVDYGVKAVYAALMHSASNTALAASDLDIQTVVTGLDASDTRIDPRIEVVRELGGGRTLIRTPRYQAYTDVLVRLARRGRDVIEIAGNRRILVTVVAPPSPLPSVAGARELFDVPIQSRPDRRRVALDVSVERLAEAIRTLERAGIAVEHVYDY